MRAFVPIYGVTCYLLGVTSLLGWIGAMFGLLPFNLASVEYSGATSYAAVAGLMLLFGMQHSVMARASTKRWLTRIIPPAAERATFVLATAIVLWAMLLLWPAMPTVIWSVENQSLRYAITAVAALGFAYLFIATFAINHFELFGLQQVYQHFKGQPLEPVPFRERLMYRFDRHPIMTGAIVGTWATPEMTLDHLLFAAMLTVYIVIGVSMEERDLRKHLGEAYRAYAERVKNARRSRARRRYSLTRDDLRRVVDPGDGYWREGPVTVSRSIRGTVVRHGYWQGFASEATFRSAALQPRHSSGGSS